MMDDLELEENKTTRYIAKKLITKNDSIDTTYKGKKVINSSMEPTGMAKATINENNGTIEIEKYDPEWCGEVNLNVEAIDADDSSYCYCNDYTVQFLDAEGSMHSYSEMGDDIEYLSDESYDDIAGGGYGPIAKSVTVTVAKGKQKNKGEVYLSGASSAYAKKTVLNGKGSVTAQTYKHGSGMVFRVTAFRSKTTATGPYTYSMRVNKTKHSWYQVKIKVYFK